METKKLPFAQKYPYAMKCIWFGVLFFALAVATDLFFDSGKDVILTRHYFWNLFLYNFTKSVTIAVILYFFWRKKEKKTEEL